MILKKGKLTGVIAVIMCFLTMFAYTDFSSAAISPSKVKNAEIKTLKVTSTDDGDVVVKWSKATGKCGINRYVVYASASENGKFHAVKTVTLSSKEMKKNTYACVDTTGYADGSTVYYKVRGKKKVKGKTCYTRSSAVKPVKIKINKYNSGIVMEAENVKYHEAQAEDSKGNPISVEGNPVMQRKYVESFDRQDPLVSDKTSTLHYSDISNGKQINLDSEVDLKNLFTTDIAGSDGKSIGTLQKNWSVIADGIMATGGKCACQEDCDYNTLCKDGGNRLDLDVDLASASEEQRGSRSKKCCMRSGLCYAGSLAQVREKMRDQVVYLVDSRGIKKEKDLIMGVGNSDGENKPVLTEINDSTSRPVIYTIASAVDSRAGINDYDYASFGLIFYDFSLTPIADKNIEQLSSADGFESAEKAQECGVSGLSLESKPERVDMSVNNKGTSTAHAEKTYTVGTEQTMTYSQSNSKSVKTSHGTNLNLGFNEGWTSLFSTTQGISYNFTYEEMMSTTEGESKSFKTSESKSDKVSTDVPAHTYKEMYVVKTVSRSDDEQKAPMELKYKVAIVSFSGQVYSDYFNAYVRTLGYDHANFTTQFGVGDDTGKSQGNGYDARESLDKRAVINENNKSVDDSVGEVHKFYFVFKKYGYDVFSKNDGIDWTEMSTDVKNSVKAVAGNVPILSNGAKMKIDTTKFDFTIKPEVPLYQMTIAKLVPIGVQEQIVDTIELEVDDRQNVYNAGVRVQGYDNGGPDKQYTAFHGFAQNDGYWIECDEEGNVLNEEEQTGVFKIINNGKSVKAVKQGKGYIIWGLSDDKDIRKKFNTVEKPEGTSVNAWDTDKGEDDAVINATNSVVKIVVK